MGWKLFYDIIGGMPCGLKRACASGLGAVDAAPFQAPFIINQLSRSPDGRALGRTLAVSTFRRLPGATQPEQPIPVILAVNTATGTVRMLVRGAQDGVFAPSWAALAHTAGVRPGR